MKVDEAKEIIKNTSVKQINAVLVLWYHWRGKSSHWCHDTMTAKQIKELSENEKIV